MKRYQFRLEAVRKVRSMNEEACRSALGLLMVERQNLVELIETITHDIENSYKEQELHLTTGMRAGHLAFFPQAVSGREAKIKEVQAEMAKLDIKIEEKKIELNTKRAELKVVENLKEKDFLDWKKKYNKETDLKVEEMVQLWGENQKSLKEEL
ncbi:MAG: flagellar FliJ family protein [Bacteriovoracaceae bacterium]|nr:flagellar FliJ family protein [Bacteriovoracaceae bacterium]